MIFKTCKLIPVLVGGILIQGKRYGPLDFVAAGVMCVGLATFTIADSQVWSTGMGAIASSQGLVDLRTSLGLPQL